MTSFNWKAYWSGRPPLQGGAEEALKQVGKTQFGRPVSIAQVDLLADYIADRLDLSQETRALDLGCGNGLVTHALAARVREVIGVDYSASLLESARSNFSRENIAYLEADLGRIDRARLPVSGFNAAWSIEVIQNLDPALLRNLLRWLADTLAPDFRFLASGVPDISRIRAFYNTDERWKRHQENAAAGKEQMGRWWRAEELLDAACDAGLKATVCDLPKDYYTAHYRFDVLFWRE